MGRIFQGISVITLLPFDL